AEGERMAIQTRRADVASALAGFGAYAVQAGNDGTADQPEALRQLLEQRIAHWLDGGAQGEADLLNAAMRAGTLSAGKRLRPLLLMLVARDLGCNSPALVDVACAVEMVHAASLM